MYASVPGKHVFDLLHLEIAQVIGPIVGSLSNSTSAVYGVALIVIFVGIALPAVWSRKPARRKAAAEVLDSILRFIRPRA
jgi:hypothetical protein